jgi:hypothetical protein
MTLGQTEYRIYVVWDEVPLSYSKMIWITYFIIYSLKVHELNALREEVSMLLFSGVFRFENYLTNFDKIWCWSIHSFARWIVLICISPVLQIKLDFFSSEIFIEKFGTGCKIRISLRSTSFIWNNFWCVEYLRISNFWLYAVILWLAL